MQFSILHTIRYTYSRAVFLEPHVVRLQPRHCGTQWLREFDVQVTPQPAGIAHGLDAEGNTTTTVWFDGEHPALAISVRARGTTQRENPFDYLLLPDQCQLPLEYDASLRAPLAPACERPVPSDAPDAVAQFAARLEQDAGGELLAFLERLNQTIYSDFESIRRDEGDPWPAAETLASSRGSCRDVAVLFVDACRSRGIAARFVSGYQEGDAEQDDRDLHAWAEVYVPGAGWRGYDPTHGLAVADRHVAVAASILPANAAPVIGSFRGTGATANMETHIVLHVQHAPWSAAQIQQQQLPRS